MAVQLANNDIVPQCDKKVDLKGRIDLKANTCCWELFENFSESKGVYYIGGINHINHPIIIEIEGNVIARINSPIAPGSILISVPNNKLLTFKTKYDNRVHVNLSLDLFVNLF